MESTGFFTISLDFELYWGVRHVSSLSYYEENIRNVHKVVPALLELFDKNGINATWCVVGFLFFQNKLELLQNMPSARPSYKHDQFDPYLYIEKNELDPVYHFAPELIKLIQKYPRQEIGTHTLSHYFCLEEGQNEEQFAADIKKAIEILSKREIKCDSIIFPRNQYANSYLEICKGAGIKYYRGSENAWYYQQGGKFDIERPYPRFLRLIDAYLNLSGHNTYQIRKDESGLINIPASKFLRPYTPTLRLLENSRFNRIANAMTNAAKNKRGYHLWWHPHNFGKHTNENLLFLGRIIDHYKKLHSKYGFACKAMNEYL